MRYRVLLTPTASRDLSRLDPPIRSRVDRAMAALGDDPRPRGCKRLAGSEALYRVRVGDYRLVYEVRDVVLVVLVVRIGHRRDVYRGL